MGNLVPFKTCAKCGYDWETKEQFVGDESVRVIAYQAMFDQPEMGLYFFIHEARGCHLEFTLTVGSLASLYRGERAPELGFLNSECEAHCFLQHDLEPCGADCSMRWPREILQYLRTHKLPDR